MLPFANPRHAHEYRIFEQFPIDSDQVIVGGVIDVTSNFVEHPQVVADRLVNLSRSVGSRKNILAGTDCGFDTVAGLGRVTEDVVWAKLKSLSEEAAIASGTLGLAT